MTRNLRKSRGYIMLNLIGLAIGLTSFIFISKAGSQVPGVV